MDDHTQEEVMANYCHSLNYKWDKWLTAKTLPKDDYTWSM